MADTFLVQTRLPERMRLAFDQAVSSEGLSAAAWTRKILVDAIDARESKFDERIRKVVREELRLHRVIEDE